jgi:hypothetical protein
MDKNQLKRLAGIPVITENKWSGKVETKKTPPDGLFAEGTKAEICEWLKANHKDYASAMASLNFYINRAGRNLDAQRRATLESCKNELRKAYGVKEALEPFDIEYVRKIAGLVSTLSEESTEKSMIVKINGDTKKALHDISTYRTIKVIPKRGGTVAVVSGSPADIEEVKRRWPILASSITEEFVDLSEESTEKSMIVKINGDTKKALHDISTYRTIKVIPKRGGTVAVVSGSPADIEEVKRRWPILASSITEEKEFDDEEAEKEEVNSIITKIAAKVKGKTGDELIKLIQQVYDAGFKDGEEACKVESKDK